VRKKSKMPKRKNPISLAADVGLSNPHKFVAQAIKNTERLRGTGKAPDWFESLWSPPVHRMYRIQDALFKALERHRYDFEPTQHNICFVEAVVRGERIKYSIFEHAQRWRVRLSKQELREAREQGKRRLWKYVDEPTGTLVVAAQGIYRGIGNGRWTDEPDRPLEAQIETVILGFEAVAAEAAARRAEDVREEEEAEALKTQRKRSRCVEDRRWNAMYELMDEFESAHRLRQFIDRIETYTPMRPDQEKRVRKFTRWARVHADRIDPLSEGFDHVLARLGLPRR
jgi:hypothetical protein